MYLYTHVCLCVPSLFSCVRLFATLWTVACWAPLSMRFSRQEYWSGLSCPSPGDLPNSGIKSASLTSPAFLYVYTYISILMEYIIAVVQWLSHVQLFATPWTAACQASLPFTISQSLLKLKSIESVMPTNHLVFCCPLLLLPSIFLSISPSNEYSGLISFRIDCFDILSA